jgi:hypothetical protein
MTSGAQTLGGRLELPWLSSCLLCVLFGSRAFLALRWTTLEMILGEVVSQCGFTWWLSLPTWGVDVDGLAFPIHRPTVHSCQMRGQGLLPGAILSYRCSGRWHLSGDVKLPERRYLMES